MGVRIQNQVSESIKHIAERKRTAKGQYRNGGRNMFCVLQYEIIWFYVRMYLEVAYR